MTRISFPRQICSDFQGYQFLARLSHRLALLRNERIELDFSQVDWFEANLCAVLGAIVSAAEENLNSTVFLNMNPVVKGSLER